MPTVHESLHAAMDDVMDEFMENLDSIRRNHNYSYEEFSEFLRTSYDGVFRRIYQGYDFDEGE